MNEYSFLLRDALGVYTIIDKKISLIEYEEDYEDFNYGFFDTDEILLPSVFKELQDKFDILICERKVIDIPTIVDISDNESDAEVFTDRFVIVDYNEFVLPNGDRLPLDADINLLPTSIVDYSIGMSEKIFNPVKIKEDGEYTFYVVEIDKQEWYNIDKVEAILLDEI